MNNARAFHEKLSSQKEVLSLLRQGKALTKFEWENVLKRNGSRLAPTIEQLRNCYGFEIDGDGTSAVTKNGPYMLKDPNQLPVFVKCTEKHKNAYYQTSYWHDLRLMRRDNDGDCCVLCHDTDDPLQCHHVYYDLFNERLEDLMTVCVQCHGRVHQQRPTLKFPSGIKPEHVLRLGMEPPEFEPWLLPRVVKQGSFVF